MKILAIDGSLTATGMAVVSVSGTEQRTLDVAFIATEPDAKSKHTYQADKDGLRVDDLVDVLLSMLDMHRPDVVAVEAPAGSQHAVSAKALGLVYGAIRGTLRARGLVPIMVQAHHAKKAATGDQHATKDAVVAAMRARFPEADLGGSKKRREAIADALSVACGALLEPTVQAMARGLWAVTGPTISGPLHGDGAPAGEPLMVESVDRENGVLTVSTYVHGPVRVKL